MQEAVQAARAGDHVRAEELGLRAADERPGFVDPLFLVAAVREKGGRYEEAREAYRRILGVDPTATRAAVALAGTYLAEGRFDDGADWLRRAIEEDPGAEAAVFNLGSVAASQDRLDEAAGWFRLAGAMDPRDPRALVQIARLRMSQGRVEDARRAAEEAVRRAPDYAAAQQALEAASAGAPSPPR